MGKWAIVPAHPSNAFFYRFLNCLPYRNCRESTSALERACGTEPPAPSEGMARSLSWEDAKARLCGEAAAISRRDAARNERMGGRRGGKGASRGTLLEEGSREIGIRRLSTLSAESTMSPSESSDGYGSVALITP